FTPHGQVISAIAWQAGSISADGTIQLPQLAELALRMRQRADKEHHLLFSIRSVAAGVRLLQDPAKWQNTVAALRGILVKLPATSAFHLDWEYLPPRLAGDFVAFIHKIRSELSPAIRIFVPVFAPVGMPEAWHGFHDHGRLANAADGIIVMLYDLHRPGSAPGCVSTISWLDENLKRLQPLPREKVWLAAPLYGYHFQGSRTRAISRTQFEKILAKEELSDGCRRKTSENAFYPADTLYRHFQTAVHQYGFAGLALWRAGWEQ
ncbi:MAG: glycosyl hydrolase family 18 protein, partial [Leptospiraceae bacterium]|nr:glycosyl hydrolase family 18 protein [Leptospiraceae bacterium]